MVSAVVLGVSGGLAAAIVVVCLFYLWNKRTEYPCTGTYSSKKDLESVSATNVALSQPPQEFFIPKEKVAIQPGARASRLSLSHISPVLRQTEINETKQLAPQHPTKQVDSPSPIKHNETSPSPPSDPERQSITSESSIMSLGSFDSEIGAVKPELYARKDEKLVLSNNGEPSKSSKKKMQRGRLHVKLQYNFDRSDFIIRIIEAKGLPAMDFGGSSDPYVKVWLEPDPERKVKQTAVQRRTLNPTFNETFKFPMTYEELQERTVRMNVFDFDKFSRHDAIGDVEIKIADVDVSRELDVWSDLEDPTKRHEELGDLCFSLSYLPTAERLTVVIMQARNLKTMDISGSSDPYVKVSLLQGGKRMKKKKTSVKKCNVNPVWNESLMFNIPAAALKTCSLEFIVIDYDLLGHSDKIGSVLVGPDCQGLGQQHWEDMIEQPRKPVVQWHTLEE